MAGTMVGMVGTRNPVNSTSFRLIVEIKGTDGSTLRRPFTICHKDGQSPTIEIPGGAVLSCRDNTTVTAAIPLRWTLVDD